MRSTGEGGVAVDGRLPRCRPFTQTSASMYAPSNTTSTRRLAEGRKAEALPVPARAAHDPARRRLPRARVPVERPRARHSVGRREVLDAPVVREDERAPGRVVKGRPARRRPRRRVETPAVVEQRLTRDARPGRRRRGRQRGGRQTGDDQGQEDRSKSHGHLSDRARGGGRAVHASPALPARGTVPTHQADGQACHSEGPRWDGDGGAAPSTTGSRRARESVVPADSSSPGRTKLLGMTTNTGTPGEAPRSDNDHRGLAVASRTATA